MKTARLLLLVLLAVLLPLRGALAEVAHCAGMPNEPVRMVSHSQVHVEAGAADTQHDPAVHDATHEHASHEHVSHPHAAHDAAAHHEATHGHETGAGHDPHETAATHAHAPGDADAADRCNLCSASCSATPVLSALPQLAAPLPLAAAPFPAFDAPAPSHASEGQERPPRST